MLSRFLKNAAHRPSRPSHHLKPKPRLEVLENRDLMSASNPMAGVLWTVEVDFHGHFDGAAAHQPTASDFKVEIHWGDGSTTTATDVVELKPNSDNFATVASHTYAEAGNTRDLFEVDVTNLRDPLYNWVQESHGISVDQGQAGSPSNPLTGMVSSDGPTSGGASSTPATQPPAALDLWNPLNWLTPPAGAANPNPPPSAEGGQPQTSQKGPLQGFADAKDPLPPPHYVKPYGKPQMAPTPHAAPTRLHDGIARANGGGSPAKPVKPSKPLTGGTALKNPSVNGFTIQDPIVLRLNYEDLNGHTVAGFLQQLEKHKLKNSSKSWQQWIDNNFTPLVQKAYTAAQKALPDNYKNLTLWADSTVTFDSKSGKVTMTVHEHKDQSLGLNKKANQKWAALLNAQLKIVGLQ